MAELHISVVAGADIGTRLQKASAENHSVIRREVNSAMLKLASLMKANIRHNFTRRTGGLENIVIEPAVETGAGIQGRVGSPMIYARIHEYGGTISAKNVAHLTIPLAAMLTRRGVARGSARDVISSPGAYGFDSTFTHGDVIFGRSGSDYSPLFALKQSVRIPERPYMRPALTEVQPLFEVSMRRALTTLFERAA